MLISQHTTATSFLRAPVLLMVFLSGLLMGCGDDNNEQAKETPKSPVENSAIKASSTIDYSSMKLALLDVSEREYGDVNTLALLFNAPLNPDQKFMSHLNVAPPLGDPVLSTDGRTLHFTATVPEQKYTLSVNSGLTAMNATTLNIQETFSVTTRALPATVSFEVDGTVIAPGSDGGLPVLAVNVAEADINIYRVKNEKVQNFFLNYGSIARSGSYYYNNVNRDKFFTHVYTTRVQTGEAKNRRNRTVVPLTALGDITKAGVYFATISRPGGFEFESSTWFSASSIGLQLREYKDSKRIIAQDITNGQLMDKVDIKILTTNGKVWAKGQTDINGVVEFKSFPKDRGQNFILAQKGDELTVLRQTAPAFDLSGFEIGGRPHKKVELFVYSPRDIYRPGEHLVISVLKRNADGQPIAGALNIEIQNPDGTSQVAMRVQPQAAGYFQFEYDLPQSSILGDWSAVVSGPENAADTTTFKFKVEEFIPERLRLSFDDGDTKQSSFGLREMAAVQVKGAYLYGAPASGNNLTTVARVFPWNKPFQNLKGYVFGDVRTPINAQFKFDDIKLDKNGQTETIINQSLYNWTSLTTPARVRLTYSLYETGGRAINRYKNILYWPKESFVGVKPHFKNDRSDKGTSVGFDLVRANRQGVALSTGMAKVSLVREEQKYFWTYTRSNGWHYQTESKEYVVSTQMVSFADTQSTPIEVPVDWGQYRLEVTDLTAKSLTVYKFQAGASWYSAWRSANKSIRPDRVTVALDKKAYQPGDIAKIKIAAPTNGSALVMLEAGGVLKTLHVPLKDKRAEVSLPIPADLARHDAYISVFVVAPTGATDNMKKRSFGIVSLPLDRSQRALDVALDIPEKWKPEQRVQARVKVTTKDGQTPTGEMFLTLSAVDSGALSLTGYEVQNPHDYFYSQRKYGVRLTDMYEKVLEPTLADKAKILWGGDADLLRGGDKPVTDVRIVSLFSGRVDVKNGEALVPLDLPAFDGELTLTAVAFGRDAFGIDSGSIKVASPIVAQVSMPRFLALGDRANIALDVTNLTGTDGTAAVSFKAGGAFEAVTGNDQFVLKNGQKEVSNIVVHANTIGLGDLVAHVQMGKEQVTRKWGLGVRAPAPAEYSRITQVLKPGDRIDLPNQSLLPLIAETTKVQLRIGLTPDLQGSAHFNYLTKYPYGCLEQTTSKSRPFALLPSDQDRRRLGITISDSEIKAKVDGALARYFELQLPNGGFGLWNKHSPEEHWLTAYATEYLLDLKASGFNVSQSMLDKALKRLNAYVRSRSPIVVKRWMNTPAHYQVAYRSYAAYILAKAGKTTLGPVLDIAEKYLDNVEGPVPGVHLGLAMMALGNSEEGVRVIEKNLMKPRSAQYLGDYGSDIRDRAMVLDALLNTNGLPLELSDKVLQMILPLAEDLKLKRWLSTQERSALFKLSLTLSKQGQDTPWSGELQVAQNTITMGAKGEFGKTLALSAPSDAVQFVNTSAHNVYASFAWIGVPKVPKFDVNNGIKITSDHFKMAGDKAIPLQTGDTLKTGEIILTRVTMTSKKTIPDALLVNFLPAGLELENQNLANALKLDSLNILGEKVVNASTLVHQEFRSDRYVAALKLNGGYSTDVYFISRAVNPGTYLVPPARVESMYVPTLNGTGNSIRTLTVER